MLFLYFSCFLLSHTLRQLQQDNTMVFEKSVVKQLRQIDRFQLDFIIVLFACNKYILDNLQLQTEAVLSRWIYLLWLKNFQASDSNERHSPGTQKLLVFVTPHVYYIHTLFTKAVQLKTNRGRGSFFGNGGICVTGPFGFCD